MDWNDILAAFRKPQHGYPAAAARAVLDDAAHYESLLAEFVRISTQPDEMADSMFHLHAMHLLAEKRDKRAFKPLLQIAALDEEALDLALGDHLTESFKCCVAATCDDESLVREFIENHQHAEWARYVLVAALTHRVIAGDSPAEPLLEWLCACGEKTRQWLKDQPLSVNTAGDELLMGALAKAIAAIGSLSHLPTLQQWWDDGLLDPQTAGMAWYARELNRPLAERLERFSQYRHPYVPDAIGEMSRWYCFSDEFHNPRAKARVLQQPLPQPPAKVLPCRHEQAKVGRNDPCPCGSGKKYKKCCAA